MSKEYFNTEVDKEILGNLKTVFDMPLAERTNKQNLLRDVLMTQVAIVVLSQYSDGLYEQEQKDNEMSLKQNELIAR